jgi:hypothetical protein
MVGIQGLEEAKVNTNRNLGCGHRSHHRGFFYQLQLLFTLHLDIYASDAVKINT